MVMDNEASSHVHMYEASIQPAPLFSQVQA